MYVTLHLGQVYGWNFRRWKFLLTRRSTMLPKEYTLARRERLKAIGGPHHAAPKVTTTALYFTIYVSSIYKNKEPVTACQKLIDDIQGYKLEKILIKL